MFQAENESGSNTSKTLKLCPECFSEFQDDVDVCPQDSLTLSPIEPDPLLGTTLQDRYQIVSVLGRGGMGVVYKARHEQMDRFVAIKMLHSHMVSDADAMKRFHREAKAVSRVKHSHSIMLYDFGVTVGRPFIVMDYIEGTNLKRVIKQSGPQPLDRVEHIFQQVVEALSCAHTEGVIHRDLKPENIMLTERAGDSDFVQVVDFGISKLKSRDEEGASEYNITRIGDVCGSPPYMSPEQCLSTKPIDFRSDIYALGVVLYEALSGRLPFKAKTAIEMIDCHLYAPPTPLKAANPDLALCDSLNNMLMKSLQKEPERRQQSMQEFGRELSEAIRRDKIKVQSAKSRTSMTARVEGQSSPVAGEPDLNNQTKVATEVRSDCDSQSKPSQSSNGGNSEGGIWHRFLSIFLPGGHGHKTAQGLVLDNCPYCASTVKPNVKFCLECGRNLPSLQELTKLRLAQGVFSFPKSHRSEGNQEALDFSTKAKIVTSRSGRPLGIPRFILILNLLLLILLCFVFLPRSPQPQQNQMRDGQQTDRHHIRRKGHRP